MLFYIEAIVCGLFAVLWVNKLTMPGEVLSWFPALARRIVTGTSQMKYENSMKPWQFGLLKILYGCSACLSFWVALVYFLLVYSFRPTDLFLFCTVAVFIAWLLEKYIGE